MARSQPELTPSRRRDEAPIILWIGRFFTHDGYGTAARLHVGALRELGAPVVAIDLDSRDVVGSSPHGVINVDRTGGQLRVSASNPNRPICAIVHERPDKYPHVAATGRSRLVGYSYWETTSLPDTWSSLMSSMDSIWTSSRFNADVFVQAGVPEWMIELVAHPVDHLALSAAGARDELRSRWPESTVFLAVVSSNVGRRDLNLLFEAFAMAFDHDDDVALVLKAPAAGADSVTATLQRVMRTMPARSRDRWPKVYTVADTLTGEQMARLLASVDCYVSCERGNGWDLPAMESMTMGIPVVATNFGGSTMFVQADDGYVVEADARLVDCDDTVDRRHSLYSGHYWPYVDPSSLAAELRKVHENPHDRRTRGAAVAERIRCDYARSRVASEVLALTSSTRDIDYRSNLPAVVRIAPDSSAWHRFEAQPSTSVGRLHDVMLLDILNDPDFLYPRHPRRLLRTYKTATRYARANGGELSGSAVGQDVSAAMKQPIRRPARKLRAVAGLRRRVVGETRRLGGREEVQRLADTMTDYQRTVGGAPSRFPPEQLAELRRAADRMFGPFRSPEQDLARLGELRGRHHGERVFILGNGPSLLKCDLAKLADEYTFGVNKIYLLFDQIDWRPSFYTLLDWKMGAAVRNDIGLLDGTMKFVPERFRGVLPPGPETYWYWTRPFGAHVDDQFEPDIVNGIPSRATILVTAIQQAFYLGFRDIVLIGVDGEYTIPPTVEQRGPDQFGTGVRLHLTSTEDDDPNHFAPHYFGKGATWHDPNVADMHRLFRLMRKGVERHGGRLRNATVGGKLEELERVGYDELFGR